MQRSQSNVVVGTQDWLSGWDTHPTLASAPRMTISTAGKRDIRGKKWEKWEKPGDSPRRSRETYVDLHQKQAFWKLSPGQQKTDRLFDAVKDTVNVNGVQVEKSALRRPFNTSTDRNVGIIPANKIKISRLPTSYLTPGPGAYTAFSSFGAPSGPSRMKYLGINAADNCGNSPASKSGAHGDV
eukprot:TRINITY_DN76358_c0_g1_i1.p1 TRINITY_DN76358_c0_g1~~TRINITY_DN76358_c0_g1_i1.p1  ORF type:complete len:183 (+),score=30.29 TRINITY_DN76358_c0_g1_i1:194-742(+)